MAPETSAPPRPRGIKHRAAYAALAILLTYSIALAQAGDLGSDNFLIDLWEAAKLAGPFGTMLMAFVWWRSDAERKALQTASDDRLERMIDAMNGTAEAIKENTKAILFLNQKGT